MSEIPKLINLYLNSAILSMLAGASFTVGCCLVCRAMAWAPVNITVNLANSAAVNSEENAAWPH